MAADSLIDQYLDAFGSRVRSRRDRRDLVDEVADHLMSAADRLEALGVERGVAERRALARFGEPTLVASLITAVPSKGSTMSLFFSRHLGAVAGVAAALWIVATVAAFFGMSGYAEGWTQARYLTGAAVIALACLATTAVLIGVNLRATGQFDGSTVAITALGVASAVASGVLAWLVGLWIPLLAAAVTWTMVRALRTHAGSAAFARVLIVGMPLFAIFSLIASAIGVTTNSGTELLSWVLFAGMAVLLAAGLVDLAVRLVWRITHSPTAIA